MKITILTFAPLLSTIGYVASGASIAAEDGLGVIRAQLEILSAKNDALAAKNNALAAKVNSLEAKILPVPQGNKNLRHSLVEDATLMEKVEVISAKVAFLEHNSNLHVPKDRNLELFDGQQAIPEGVLKKFAEIDEKVDAISLCVGYDSGDNICTIGKDVNAVKIIAGDEVYMGTGTDDLTTGSGIKITANDAFLTTTNKGSLFVNVHGSIDMEAGKGNDTTGNGITITANHAQLTTNKGSFTANVHTNIDMEAGLGPVESVAYFGTGDRDLSTGSGIRFAKGTGNVHLTTNSGSFFANVHSNIDMEAGKGDVEGSVAYFGTGDSHRSTGAGIRFVNDNDNVQITTNTGDIFVNRQGDYVRTTCTESSRESPLSICLPNVERRSPNKALTVSPTKEPTPQPTTASPTKNPTSNPTTNSPTWSPLPAGSFHMPECEGATCGTYTPCEGNSCGNPICGTTYRPDFGLCLDGETSCRSLESCPDGSCPMGSGSICIINTCCGGPVCVPPSAFCTADTRLRRVLNEGEVGPTLSHL